MKSVVVDTRWYYKIKVSLPSGILSANLWNRFQERTHL